MAFIDYTYFINDINVPGTTLNSSYGAAIERYEPEILKRLLGYELHKALIADSNGGVPQTQRFLDLVNGAEFSFEYFDKTINTKWEGLINSKKVSLISYYVYFQDRNENEQFNSDYGQVQSLGENSTKVNVQQKLIYTWNKMIELYGHTPKVIFYNSESYFLNIDNYEHYDMLPSAYNFLLANKNDYPEWVFMPIKQQNIFGI